MTREGWERHVTARCPNIGRHTTDLERFPGCACHPKIPQPCPDCYAVETLSRRVPWSALGLALQPGAASDGDVLPDEVQS